MPLRVTTGTAIPLPEPDEADAALAVVSMLDVPYIPQGPGEWCWAACCDMVFQYYQVQNVQQCDMASFQFNVDCCADPYGDACNKPNWPDAIYEHWNFHFVPMDDTLPFLSIQDEIQHKRPVEVFFTWSEGGAHAIIIRGYYANGDVEINDPKKGFGRFSFQDIEQAYGKGTWTSTYYQIQPKGNDHGPS